METNHQKKWCARVIRRSWRGHSLPDTNVSVKKKGSKN
jgi:hypothetical protein